MSLMRRNDMPRLLSDWFGSRLYPDALFDRDLFDFGGEVLPSRLGVSVPSVNVKETPQSYLLEVAAPGLDKNDFHVELNNHTLSISAEKEETKEEKGYSRREYSYNSFRRSFSLPQNVNEHKIDARYDNGILKVSVPKAEETKSEPPHTIQVG